MHPSNPNSSCPVMGIIETVRNARWRRPIRDTMRWIDLASLLDPVVQPRMLLAMYHRQTIPGPNRLLLLSFLGLLIGLQLSHNGFLPVASLGVM